MRECIAESNGALKREDFFIVSKLWNIFHSKEKVEKALDDTLKRFGFDYLDLFLVHWPMGFKEDAGNDPMDSNGKYLPSEIHFTETYRELEEMVRKGKTKSIGLSNFNPRQVKEILDMCTIRPVCNQFEVNPNLHNNEWIDYCKKENIAVVAYAPLGAPDRMWLKEEDPVPLKSEIVLNLAKKYNKSPAQVILRWLIQRDVIIIPKSANPSRLAENLNVKCFSFFFFSFIYFATFILKIKNFLFKVIRFHFDARRMRYV